MSKSRPRGVRIRTELAPADVQVILCVREVKSELHGVASLNPAQVIDELIRVDRAEVADLEILRRGDLKAHERRFGRVGLRRDEIEGEVGQKIDEGSFS